MARVWGSVYMWGEDGDGLGWAVNGPPTDHAMLGLALRADSVA